MHYTEYGGSGHGIWGQVFNLESLYKDLKKCQLSDRYTAQPDPEPVQKSPNILAYILYAATGVVAAAAVAVVLVLIRKKKKK